MAATILCQISLMPWRCQFFFWLSSLDEGSCGVRIAIDEH